MAKRGPRRGKHYSVSGLLGPVLTTHAPARVRGVVQLGGEIMPTACPHCRDTGAWTYTEWEGRCWSCGATYYRTQYEIGPPVHHARGNPHPVPIP